MSQSTTIREFLASVGFIADKASLKRSLATVTTFAASVKMITAGIYAGLINVATGEQEIAQKAKLLGTSSDKLQELGYIAEQTGSSMDAIVSSMNGLKSKNPYIKDSAKALEMFGKRLKGMNEQQQRLYASRMGIDPTLIPMLTRDVSGLKDEFKAMYGVATYDAKEAALASQGFLAEINKFKTMASLLAKSVALSFMGKIKKDVESLRRALVENFDKIKKALEWTISIVLRLSSIISAFVYRGIKIVSSFIGWLENLDDSQRKLVIGAGLLLAAWRLLNLGFLATPLGMIITGLLGILALVDDYLTFMEGGESYFDWGPWAETIETVLSALKPMVDIIGGAFKGGLVNAFHVLKSILDILGFISRTIWNLAKYLYQFFTGDLAGAAETARTMFSDFSDTVKNIFKNLVDGILGYFTELWPSVEEHFPDFAAWAQGAKDAIFDKIGSAIDWAKNKLDTFLGWLPDGAKKFLGISTGSGTGTDAEAVNKDASTAHLNAMRTHNSPNAHLSPAMQMASNTKVDLKSETTINMHSSDPVAAGNQVAGKQGQINADLVRNTKARIS